ncbi:Phosphoglucosamine mutase [Clostridium sp. C105KSO13]|nr:Phosphoglucosamine mutase [Clostridium sp. C105KSO13]
MGKYFGTDGFRGEAGITLTADHAYKVGRFLGWYYNALCERNGNNEPARIVIGKDTRRSSYMFEYSLVAGLTAWIVPTVALGISQSLCSMLSAQIHTSSTTNPMVLISITMSVPLILKDCKSLL